MDEGSVVARVEQLASALSAHAQGPKLGIVLGSGLSEVADALERPSSVAYGDLPEMPTPSVPGHAGAFVFGSLRGVPTLVMRGRVHAYEGHSVDTVVLGVRAMRRLGVETFVLTNAAGGIREDLEPGDLMMIGDHLNLTGLDPGVGMPDGPLGPRFQNLVETWDPALRIAIADAASVAGIPLTEGVYAGLRGPSYETPAEVRMLRTCGADAVGMSTVLEAIALRRMGARLVGFSCITNRAAGRQGAILDHHDVERHAKGAAERVAAIVSLVAGELA